MSRNTESVEREEGEERGEKLITELRDTLKAAQVVLAVALAWPNSAKIRSRINNAILDAEEFIQ